MELAIVPITGASNGRRAGKNPPRCDNIFRLCARLVFLFTNFLSFIELRFNILASLGDTFLCRICFSLLQNWLIKFLFATDMASLLSMGFIFLKRNNARSNFETFLFETVFFDPFFFRITLRVARRFAMTNSILDTRISLLLKNKISVI